MKVRILVIVCLLLLTGCNNSPCLYKNYCQIDYWGDHQYNIFGRKNCVGRTGTWVDQGNGRDGYFCSSPRCGSTTQVSCTDTCSGN